MRSYTEQEQSLMKNFRNNNPHICYYCGRLITNEKEVTIDHKLPVSRGGKTVMSNFCIACEHCNKEKDNMTEEEYNVFLEVKDSNMALKRLSTALNEQNLIINNYIELHSQKKLLDYKKIQVNNMITSENFNAARGYMLAKELQGYNLEIVKIEEQFIHEPSITSLAKDQANKIRIERNKLLKQLLITHRNRNKNLNRMLRAVI